jgi:hypothetical protein
MRPLHVPRLPGYVCVLNRLDEYRVRLTSEIAGQFAKLPDQEGKRASDQDK